LSGSRSGILSVGMVLLMGILAVKQNVMINKKIILTSFIIIPVSIVFFSLATFKQQLGIKGVVPIKQLMFDNQEVNFFDLKFIEQYLPIIYYRLGYLDYSTELIANRQKFEKIINGQYYFESTIDNVLTPGFDIFSTPRASHALSYTRRGDPLPDIYQITKYYQSDQMGIYGEYYVFFNGYPALAVFFFMAIFFQTVFVNLQGANSLLTCIYKAVILNLFYIWLNSFGMDWFFFDVVAMIVTTFIFARYYVNKRKRKFVFRVEPKESTDNAKLAM